MKNKDRPPFLCLPSTCQTTVATVTWAPCYCLPPPLLLLPGVLFETKPSTSPLYGGDLTLHMKKKKKNVTPLPVSFVLMEALCFVVFTALKRVGTSGCGSTSFTTCCAHTHTHTLANRHIFIQAHHSPLKRELLFYLCLHSHRGLTQSYPYF